VLLGNVTSPRPGRDTQHVELDLTYLAKPDKVSDEHLSPSRYSWRGLWAQCHVECQWFWQHDYQLQSSKFTALRKLPVQITNNNHASITRARGLLTIRSRAFPASLGEQAGKIRVN